MKRMEEKRPPLAEGTDASTLRSYDCRKEELEAHCREKELPVSGSKGGEKDGESIL